MNRFNRKKGLHLSQWLYVVTMLVGIIVNDRIKWYWHLRHVYSINLFCCHFVICEHTFLFFIVFLLIFSVKQNGWWFLHWYSFGRFYYSETQCKYVKLNFPFSAKKATRIFLQLVFIVVFVRLTSEEKKSFAFWLKQQ